jgi:acetolactate synthase I/II/III large subunit
MLRVTDYITKFLVEEWVKDTFLVTGAWMMFLSDGLYLNDEINHYCMHHEQAVAMAAVGYAKMKNSLWVAYVSTGCGGTNAITGLLHAYQDNTPVLFLSGQVKLSNTTRVAWLKLRGFGVQEADIIPVVESLSKYSVMVTDPTEIAYHLEKAVYIAKSWRPGPVWIDLPMDIQSASIDETTLSHFRPEEYDAEVKIFALESEIQAVKALLQKSERPVIVCGQWVRLSHSVWELKEFLSRYKVPVVCPYMGIGILPTDDSSFIGRIGAKWDRPWNFTIQNADLVLVLWSSLCPSAIGYDGNMFARWAKMIVVDIDKTEHQKKMARVDTFIHSDLNFFLTTINQSPIDYVTPQKWIDTTHAWKQEYPVVLPEYSTWNGRVNLYHFVDVLWKKIEDSVVISDAGSAFYVPTQWMPILGTNRYITSGWQAEMGFTLPGAIGACIAHGRRSVIGITGDGSFQFNIQELQTIVHHHLPIKLVVWNNNGYLSIRASQDKFFEKRYIGTDESSGVSFPDTEKIANAYGIAYMKIHSTEEVESWIEQMLASDGPMICEVMCLENQEIIPATSTFKKPDGTLQSRPLEDMYPFLGREEFMSNMITPIINDE